MGIDNINYPAPKQEYKVLVRCFTFNHSKFIEEAFNGFAMQQTNFPFACLVMDDASTDGEQEVIKAWMECECDMERAETIDIPTSVVIIVPHKTNTSCTFAFYLLKQNLYKAKEEKMRHVTPWREKCEYEAMCEGDDYWIDPMKLQRQVEIMESDDSIGLCYTRAKIFNQKLGSFEPVLAGKKFEGISQILCENPVVTLTAIYKTRVINNYLIEIDPYVKEWKMGDYPLWLFIYEQKDICFINDITGVYRSLEESASHSNDINKKVGFLDSFYDIQCYFSTRYKISYFACTWIKFRYCFTKVKLYISQKMFSESVKYLVALPFLFVIGCYGYVQLNKINK